MYLWGFGCLLRLALLFGTTNSLDMALFSTVVADLVLVKTIVCHMCVPTTAVARGGGRDPGPGSGSLKNNTNVVVEVNNRNVVLVVVVCEPLIKWDTRQCFSTASTISKTAKYFVCSPFFSYA